MRRVFSFLLTLLLIVSLAGCTFSNPKDVVVDSPRKPGAINYPLKLTDQAGRHVTIPREPQRIVSLIPSATEIAFALQLDKRVVAVTNNDNYPAQVKKLPKVGDMKIDVEKVLAQKPDLVLASSLLGQEVLNQLQKYRIPLVVVDAKHLLDVYRSIDLVGQATNRARESDQLIAKMEAQKRAIYRQVMQIPKQQRPKVWIEIGPELFTAGGDTLLGEMLQIAGGINVAQKEKGWPQISAEQVIRWNPDVILSTYGQTDSILKRKGFSSVHAIQQKRVYAVDPDRTSRPGPRIMEGIEEMAKALYPQRFGGHQ